MRWTIGVPTVLAFSALGLATGPVAAAPTTSTHNTSKKHSAQSVLRPGTRPMAFAVGMGPALRTDRQIAIPRAAFKLSQSFMFHLSGDASGPAIGFVMQQGFNANDVFGLTLAPRFEWDIQIDQRYAIYISPGVSLGYHLYRGAGTGHAIDLQLGATAKLIIQDRWLVWFRPANFNVIIAGRNDWGMRYELMFGGGVTF